MVRAETQLRLPPKNSKSRESLRTHLEFLEERTDKRDKRLDAADVPDGLEHLWVIFWTIYRGEVLDFSELLAWSELTGEQLTPWEAETLRMMSLVAVKEANSG